MSVEALIELAAALKDAFDWEDVEGCEQVVDGEWEQDGKHQTRESVLLFKGSHFMLQQSRSGSYHTDWYYSDSYLHEVERREETKVVVSWSMPTGAQQLTIPGRD